MREERHSQTKTFAVATLGCKVNQADSEAISEQMSAAGFVQREFNEAADIYIVNTCTVTHLGDRSSRLMISQAHRRQPEALLVVTGCYAERNPEGVAALPGVDLVIGNQQKDALVESIQAHQPLPTKDEMVVAVDTDSVNTTQALASSGILLPMLSVQEQHIGSDIALEIDLNEVEPQPDNPERGPALFTASAAPGLANHAQLHTRTRVQMKVQMAVIIAAPTVLCPMYAVARVVVVFKQSSNMCGVKCGPVFRRLC